MAQIIDFTFLSCLKDYKQILNCTTNKANPSKQWRKRYPKEVRNQVLRFLHCDSRLVLDQHAVSSVNTRRK
jgi:hypothetical protein